MTEAYVNEILKRLDENYGTEYICYLNYGAPYELLIAVILSAQCTDARVNIVTEKLFRKYPTLQSFAEADLKTLERDIYSTGFYKNKAKNIIACAKRLIDVYDGVLPPNIDALTSLAGVGRKTANVILGNIYDIPSIVVDTHVKRISNILGLTTSQDPVKIEKDLEIVLPKNHWILYNIQIIRLGREICVARRPKCGQCFLADICPTGKEKINHE
ncbi:MAG: endonuclease III [Eubacteriales bacterium]|nr:endonuclease III [Eubacteriales bacterium]